MRESTMDANENVSVARAWLQAFNAHDVEALVALYAEDCTHTSPKIRVLHPETGGKLVGKQALGQWWKEAIARLPGLRYVETALTANGERVFMEYQRHVPNEEPMPVAEVLEVKGGKIVASRVYHG
jgi:ketosteroid isomerase-like protein